MHSISQLEKQQIDLRLPKYLVDEIDTLAQQFSISRTDIIIEAISSYISEQKANMFYAEFDTGSKELKNAMKNNDDLNSLNSLDSLINEIEH